MSKRTKDTDKLYPVGDFWLVPPDAKYRDYGIKWYDSAARQTRRLGTGETDFEEAKLKIKEHALKHGDGEHKDELVLQSINRYYVAYGSSLESERAVAQALNYVTQYWPDVMVSGIDAVKQKRFITSLRGLGLSDLTITRHLTTVFTAIAYAVQFNHLKESIMPARLSKRHWGVRTEPVKRRSAKPSKRQLHPEEWGRLFDATTARMIGGGSTPGESDHCLRYLITAIGTHARPAALRQLKGQQINLEHGIIDLNPPGRAQNKKRRPIVPMAPTLAKWVAHWAVAPEEYLIKGDHGMPLTTLKAIEFMIARAKLPNCTPYTFRHSVASWLAGAGIDKWERKKFLGHAAVDGGTTDDYTHYDPRYLRNAAQGIERLFEAIAPYTRVNILRRSFDDQGAPEVLWSTVPSAFKKVEHATRVISVTSSPSSRSPMISMSLAGAAGALDVASAWQVRGKPECNYPEVKVILHSERTSGRTSPPSSGEG